MTRSRPMTTDAQTDGKPMAPPVPCLPILATGTSLSAFFAISFLLCIALGLVAPDWGMHQPWLQFFPGFVWLTPGSVLLGLAESVAYAWYVALLFGGLFNFVAARAERRP